MCDLVIASLIRFRVFADGAAATLGERSRELRLRSPGADQRSRV